MNEDQFQLGIKAVVRNDEGKILLLQVNLEKLHNQSFRSYWDIPGGRVQRNSTIEETLYREVEEETGITSIKSYTKLDMILSNLRIPVGNSTFGLILDIYMCLVEKPFEVKISDEHTQAQWFDPKEAATLLKVKYPSDFCSLIASL